MFEAYIFMRAYIIWASWGRVERSKPRSTLAVAGM